MQIQYPISSSLQTRSEHEYPWYLLELSLILPSFMDEFRKKAGVLGYSSSDEYKEESQNPIQKKENSQQYHPFMQKFDISRKWPPPFWDRKITQVKDKLQEYVKESQQAQAVMREAHSQLSVCGSDYRTSEAATRTWQSSGGAEDTDIGKCDSSNLERRVIRSGRSKD